jgi:hypothetical protein
MASSSALFAFLAWSAASDLLSVLLPAATLLPPHRAMVVFVEAAFDWHCNFYCYNGGSCRHGHGKFGSYAGIEDGAAEELPFEQVHHENGMYCVCPVGYTGLQCEIKYVVCGDDDHTCFNGSNCKKERAGLDGTVYYRCECDPDGSVMDAAYAGKYCEHIATTFCTGNGMEHGTSYCTNGGKVRFDDWKRSDGYDGSLSGRQEGTTRSHDIAPMEIAFLNPPFPAKVGFSLGGCTCSICSVRFFVFFLSFLVYLCSARRRTPKSKSMEDS